MINIRLEDAEIRKLSEITQISEFDLQKLYTEGLLNDSAVINRLMKYDFQFLKRMGKYRPVNQRDGSFGYHLLNI